MSYAPTELRSGCPEVYELLAVKQGQPLPIGPPPMASLEFLGPGFSLRVVHPWRMAGLIRLIEVAAGRVLFQERQFLGVRVVHGLALGHIPDQG